jgi:hypothetical protein
MIDLMTDTPATTENETAARLAVTAVTPRAVDPTEGDVLMVGRPAAE